MGIQSKPNSKEYEKNYDLVDWSKGKSSEPSVAPPTCRYRTFSLVELECAKEYYGCKDHAEALDRLLAELEPGVEKAYISADPSLGSYTVELLDG